jgi:hypothetical protein
VVVLVVKVAAVARVDSAQAQACLLRLARTTPSPLGQAALPKAFKAAMVILAMILFLALLLLVAVVVVEQDLEALI